MSSMLSRHVHDGYLSHSKSSHSILLSNFLPPFFFFTKSNHPFSSLLHLSIKRNTPTFTPDLTIQDPILNPTWNAHAQGNNADLYVNWVVDVGLVWISKLVPMCVFLPSPTLRHVLLFYCPPSHNSQSVDSASVTELADSNDFMPSVASSSITESMEHQGLPSSWTSTTKSYAYLPFHSQNPPLDGEDFSLNFQIAFHQFTQVLRSRRDSHASVVPYFFSIVNFDSLEKLLIFHCRTQDLWDTHNFLTTRFHWHRYHGVVGII